MHIKDASFVISSPNVQGCPKPDKPEFAFIGRSNVGKSSLINALVNKKNLAKTSGTPGKTKLINHFKVDSDLGNWYLVDLPGYGFAKVSVNERKQWEKMIRTYILERENLANIFVLVDSRHEPQKIDLEFIAKLGEWKVPFSIIFTKSDKENQRTVSQHVQEFKQALKKQWAELPPVFVTSAEKGTGVDKVLSLIDEILSQ
ncbi:ribosome biogenesis GTP-binding protein YihA/YsxC [Pollutibacter soli]|uniref:ribosome biogenesis GTP-binding protein YihA/YsxC n=1 Tax=Pollutibacter soli TaxID=3034157 RepID=UPI0030136706